ncbi:AMP-binding protein, partial [Thermodesulfobacteriota bacterium]
SEFDKRRPDPDEVALLLPSGGTTGWPKVAPRTQNSHICNAEYYSKPWEQNINDICLVVTPVGHNAALLNGIVGPILNHSKIILLDSTRPEDFCRTVQEEKVTCVNLVPALVRRLLNFEGLHNYDLSSLIKIGVGGAHSSPDLVRRLNERISCTYVNSFGMVEGPCARTRLDDDFEIICNTVGRPVCPYDEFKIIDRDENDLPPDIEGELVARGPGIFTGYLKSNNAEIFTRDGFFKTGDLAIMDELKNIRITGRIKDIIIRGGENISAGQIEDLIGTHPEVSDVAVVGMPDEELGEKVCAYVQPVSGAKPSFEEILSYLVSKGASKLLLPEKIEFVDSIPLTKVGKPNKKKLRDDIKERYGIKN